PRTFLPSPSKRRCTSPAKRSTQGTGRAPSTAPWKPASSPLIKSSAAKTAPNLIAARAESRTLEHMVSAAIPNALEISIEGDRNSTPKFQAILGDGPYPFSNRRLWIHFRDFHLQLSLRK